MPGLIRADGETQAIGALSQYLICRCSYTEDRRNKLRRLRAGRADNSF